MESLKGIANKLAKQKLPASRELGIEVPVLGIPELVAHARSLGNPEPDIDSQAFDRIAEGVWCFGSDGRTIFVNDRMANMLGYRRGEMLARPLWEFLDNDSRTRALVDGALDESEIPARVAVGLLRKDGRVLNALVSTSSFDHDGATGALALVVDIDELVKNERRLAEQAREAENANQEKTRFLSLVSHEIRSPLAAIVGFAELLADRDLNEEDRVAYTNTIVRNGRFLSKLLDDILDLGKIEAGQFIFQKSPFSLREILTDACNLFAQRAAENSVTIEVRYASADLDLVFSDRFRAQQILVNVLGNAVKFTTHGKVTLLVESWNALQCRVAGCPRRQVQEENLHIAISDTGIGIAPDCAQRLFQDYVQVDPNISRKYGGTGLGLALSRRLARALGGDVWLSSSEAGKGSTFDILLPLRS
ncbi:MAG: sensor histidine kinase [Oligoflexales bacterium]